MYHFIGIKGSGMSALAQVMKKLGYDVQGSDITEHFFTQIELDKLNVKILPFNKDNIKEGQIIVRGTTFNETNNEEVKRAKELNLKILDYPEMLGELTKKFDTIAISGTHGKTTTTGLLSSVLNNTIGTNYVIGDGTGDANKDNKNLVIEACEYQKHFLNYYPKYTVITNIDLDHVDFYKDINDIINAFQEFVDQTSTKVIACGDDLNTRKLVSDKIIYYGLNDDNDIKATNIEYTKEGSNFDCIINNELFGRFNLHIFGKHMIENALAVIYVSKELGLSKEDIEKEINSFKGVKRRFTEVVVGSNVIVDDYAHHPNEVKAMINSVRQKYPDKKLITVFKPHTFSRTKEFYKDFIDIFNGVDYAYFTEIYKSREKQEDYPDVHTSMITDKIMNSKIITLEDYNEFKDFENSVILIMSPNELTTLRDGIIDVLKEKEKLSI